MRYNKEFPSMMVKFFPKELTSTNFKITHIILDPDFVTHRKRQSVFSPKQYREEYDLEAGTYVALSSNSTGGELIMSDTPMERRTNLEFVRRAHGDILIAGLGIGMILLAIQDKKEVNSITVIEKEQEIIDLVLPQLPLNSKVNVVCEDIFKHTPNKNQLYNVIYFDIWSQITEDNYEGMKKLHRKFARSLDRSDPSCWRHSWRVEDCKPVRRSQWGW